MSEIVNAIIITEDGNAEIKYLTCDLETLQGIVGGPIEALSPTGYAGYRWFAYINGEGKMQGLPVNDAANEIATMLGWAGRLGGDFLVGPVVIVGPGDAGGNDTSVEDNVIELVTEFYRRHGQVRVMEPEG